MKIGVLDFKDFRIEDVEVPSEEFEAFIRAIDRIAQAIRADPQPMPLVSKRTEEFFPPGGKTDA